MFTQVGIIRALNPQALLSRSDNPSPRGRASSRGRGGGHSNVQENPAVGTWLLIAGATAAVVGVGVAIAAKRNNSPAIPGGGGGGTVPGGGGGGTVPGGGGGGSTKGTYVGDPKGYNNWPRMDMFPDQSAFGDALEQIGYNVGNWQAPTYQVINQPTYGSIGQFQRDWNIYRKNIASPWAPQLDADSLLGANTIRALAGVMEAVNLGALEGGSGVDWQDTIDQLK